MSGHYLAILALIKALQGEVTLLENEFNAQQATVLNYVPSQENVPLGAAPVIPTPTSTTSGSPIVYVGEQDTEPIPESCTITASVSPEIMVGESDLQPLTTVNWTLQGMPTSTRGLVSPINTSSGEFSYPLVPDQDTGNLTDTFWDYFSGGIQATFGDATCAAIFPVERSASFVPTSTIYSQ